MKKETNPYERIKLNTHTKKWQQNLRFTFWQMRLGNLGKEKPHAVGLTGHGAACKGRCINRAWGGLFPEPAERKAKVVWSW